MDRKLQLAGDWWTPQGWHAQRVAIDAAGMIGATENLAFGAGEVVYLPAITDLHSHAFQRAMAGLAEYRLGDTDDFWSWRTLMYRSLDRLDPDTMLSIATLLYIELVRQGYARVCEFHYVHNDRGGRPYAGSTAMADALIEAARIAGIGLTLLPVLYTSSDFGGAAPVTGQRRFVQSVDSYLAMLATLDARSAREGFSVGAALHSLRAVTPEQIAAVVAARGDGPIHIHAAEQVKEVEACLAWSGLRPVEWLLAHVPVGPRWTLVHATHMTDAEAAALARTGATVALCPTTEASLGDGFFNADAYFAAGGRFGIGSDSNVCTDPAEELRLLEYGRRLQRRRRVLGIDAHTPNAGAWAYRRAAEAGAAASGVATGRIETGMRGDFIRLYSAHPTLAPAGGDARIDALIFGGGGQMVRETWVGGRQVTADGRHPHEESARADYRRAIEKLKEKL